MDQEMVSDEAIEPGADNPIHALFYPSTIEGIRGSTKAFEDVVASLHRRIDAFRDERTEVIRFPPVMSRSALRRNGYEQASPHLLGCVCGPGDPGQADRGSGGAAGATLPRDSLVLTPAACYPIYPVVAARGPLPRGGLTFEVSSDCFRREPSPDIDRFQSFRMREYVRFGSEAEVAAHIAGWIERGCEMMDALGLSPTVAPASDPFFGRIDVGSARAKSEGWLKHELLLPIRPGQPDTACMSFNNHRDQFSRLWDIVSDDGWPVHSACVGFGMERITLALFARHGLSVAAWPQGARRYLSF